MISIKYALSTFGGAGKSIASGFGANIEDGIADTARGAACELLVPEDAETKDIH